AGKAIAEVGADRDGVPRPVGAAYDVGAYEWTDMPVGGGGGGGGGGWGGGGGGNGSEGGGEGSGGCGCQVPVGASGRWGALLFGLGVLARVRRGAGAIACGRRSVGAIARSRR